MNNKDLIIITLIVVIIYLAYQQNNQPVLVKVDSQVKEIQDLQQQVQHYQTLYQKRVEKDLGYSDDELKAQHQEQLRKINVLFDENAINYETIDFNGLYSLLEKIAQKKN